MYVSTIGLTLIYAIVSAIFVVQRQSPIPNLLPKVLAALAIVHAGFYLLRRDTHLPFLGPAAFPPGLIPSTPVAPANANKQVVLTFPGVADGTRIIYWGAMPSEDGQPQPDPWTAYAKFENAGIAVVQDQRATLRFHCPAQYRTPYSRRALPRHIHYRTCCDRGIMGRVETVKVAC